MLTNPQEPPHVNRSRSLLLNLWQRFSVLGIGIVLGTMISALIARNRIPTTVPLENWVAIVTGPILGSSWGLLNYHPFIAIGWFGPLAALAHPIRPNIRTAL